MTFPLGNPSGRLSRLLATGACALAAILAGCGSDTVEPGGGPGVPANVQATAISETAVRVTWDAVTGASGYVVERATGTETAFAQVATPTTPSYDDAGLTANTVYRYRVKATAGGQSSAASGEKSVTTQAAGGPKTATISADITTSRTLYADTVYTLSGFIHVANGAMLTIQPGTTILGDYNTLGSSLFILRGAKISALGTAEQPIVFTSSRPAGQRQPGDWGGLILVGNAKINRSSPVLLEGTNTGAANPAVDYSGGTNDADDSGELRYVRVEFAGYAPAQDAELNAFTFAAVGSGTKISYLQALAGLDDSYEFFGGQVDGHHLVSYESGDDHFDMSEGYQGRLQYLIAYQSKVLTPRAGAGNVSSDPQGIENDGCAGANCTNGQDSQPFTTPMVANFTLVGTGPGVVDATSGGIGMMLRRGTGGYYVNGVLARWPRAGISLRDAATNAHVTAGNLQVKNVLLTDVATVFQATSGSNTQFDLDLAANAIEQSAAASASLFAKLPTAPTSAADFDWTPAGGSAAATGGLSAFSGAMGAKAGSAVTATAFRGAADPAGAKWWAGWTAYAQN